MNETINWKRFYKFGGIAALAIVAIIPIQIVIFSVFPPPATTLGFIELFHQNWLLGLLSMDFLYYLNNTLLVAVYLGLFAALRKIDFAGLLFAVVLGFIGLGAFYASSVGFEMLSVSNQYFSAESAELQQQLLAVGHGLIARYQGTGFDVYYVFNAITLLIISWVMLKSEDFSKATAVWGLVSGVFMIIPSTAGLLGLIFSLISLIPWIVFSIMMGQTLLRMAK